MSSSRTFICHSCGKIRRRHEAWALRRGRSDWPQCCDHEMALLSHVRAAGAALLTPAERLTWLGLGAGLVRRRKRGARKWAPAVTARQASKAQADIAEYRRGFESKSDAPQAKKWALASHRKRHAKKKSEKRR